MPLFFQKFQAFTEGLTPFSLNLGIHILFFCFCFFLFGIYVFVSKVFLNFIKKAIPEKTPPWLKILTKSLFVSESNSLVVHRVYGYRSKIDLQFLKIAKAEE